MTTVTDAADTDLGWMHALNELQAIELSAMDAGAFGALVSAAPLVRVVQPEAAFVIGFDQDAAGQGPNFAWHKARFDQFLYVDRIAVSPDHRRRGLARLLYEDVIAQARAADCPRVVAEVNSDPPNPASDAFHASLGFEVVGEARLEDRGKTVRYLACPL